MLMTTLRWRRRSKSAPATIWSSPRTLPQLSGTGTRWIQPILPVNRGFEAWERVPDCQGKGWDC